MTNQFSVTQYEKGQGAGVQSFVPGMDVKGMLL